VPKHFIRRSLIASSTAAFATMAVFGQREMVRVTVKDSGQIRMISTAGATVGDVLTQEHIVLGELDRCVPAPSSPLESGAKISITRVRIDTVTETTTLSFPVRHTYDTDLRAGIKQVLVAGKPGSKSQVYRETIKDGIRVSRRLVSSKTTLPTTQVVRVGLRGMQLASRGAVPHRRILNMVATGYGPHENGRWGNRTAMGTRVGYGTVAVDPRVIPLGTRLYVEGYGYAVARDTGRLIKGRRIDLGFGSTSEARRVGRRPVRVLVLR
jgi:3D (Asp-Asp-Asp) domain-containing protein